MPESLEMESAVATAADIVHERELESPDGDEHSVTHEPDAVDKAGGDTDLDALLVDHGNGQGGAEEVPRQVAESNHTDTVEVHQLELEEVEAVTNGSSAPSPSALVSQPHAQAGHERRNGRHIETSVRPRLRARFLGGRDLLYDGKLVWPVPGEPDESAMELLVFLGVHDATGVRSEKLGDSLWEADDDDIRGERIKKKRYNLRQVVKRLVPELEGDVLERLDKQNPVHRLNAHVIESDVHRFLKLVETGRHLDRDQAIAAYEEALELYRGDLLDRQDVPPYRWLDDGPRVVDLRVNYASMRQQSRRRLADLLASGSPEQLARAEELYILLAHEDPLDHRLWEALARLHGRRNDLLGLEATWRRLRGALVELGEGDDPERVPIPPALAHVFAEVRESLLHGRVT
jgi:hypothetical protein